MESIRTRLARALETRGISAGVAEAFEAVPRERFVPESLAARAYEDRPLPIGEGQTISQPTIVALMLDALELRGHERVLEIGTGSGYETALLARLCGRVYTIERLEPLMSRACRTLADLGIANVRARLGDGTAGWPEEAPFDRIIVSAAAPEIPPTLLGQLGPEGILVVPVGGGAEQILLKLRRTPEGDEVTDVCPCAFVPLVGREGFDGNSGA